MRLAALARVLGLLAGFGLVLMAWGARRASLPDDGATTLAADALATAAFVALLAIGGALLSREAPAQRLGLQRGRFGARATVLGALGLLALSHTIEAVLTLAGAPASATLARFTETLASASPAELALALAAFALASAGAEELFFRGLLQRGLERRLGAAAAIGLAALAFGAAHGDPVHGVAAVPLGAYLGVLARLDGSIRPALAAHALNNAVAVLEAWLGVRVAPGGPALATIGVGLAVAAGALWWAHAAARVAGPPPVAPGAPAP
jgi:membrane protease YdiL (CAAX protease family)